MLSNRAWAPAAFMPPATLAAGVCQIVLSSADTRSLPAQMWLALFVAALAPPFVVFSCARIRARFDGMLIGSGFMLTSVSMVCLLNLSMAPGPNQSFLSAIVVRQGMFIGVGCIALMAGVQLAVRLDTVARYPYSLAVGALALTAMTIVAGSTVNGARLWLNIGPVRFQPSEITRILIAGFVAGYLFERRHLVSTPWRLGKLDLPPAPYLVPLGAAVLAATALLVVQNDLGMAALISLGMVAGTVGTLRSRTSVGVIVVFLALAMLIAYAITPRVQNRVGAWLDPWRDGATVGFQFIQADYALAAGGLVGATNGADATAVPEIHTDFVLAAIGNQYGFLALVSIIALSSLLVLRCIVSGLQAPSGFGTLLACCFSALLGAQLILIAGGVLRVLPLTGVTYPLVSYGGTSIVATLFVIGVVVGISAEPRVAH